ncbi:glycosyltransferase [Pigmentiphaga daeguensis]|uniref:Glycosyl transferase family 4 n=1 Tax=Pigmentiphaga daeguensis TaxID=414049 RepID=A0ABN1CX77_9BURK
MLTTSLSFAIAFISAMLIVRYASNLQASADSDLQGVQKFHTQPVPRIGGLAIAAALGLTSIDLCRRAPEFGQPIGLLALCAAPVFAMGLMEDLTKSIKPGIRLASSFVSAVLGSVLLNATVTRLDIPSLDFLLQIPIAPIVVTALCVGALVNAVNIIDGFNGLAPFSSIVMFGSLGVASLTII